MIVSLQKVQLQWEQQRTELLEQWAEARVLWEDERSFLIDERNAVMIEYKNIAVEKAKLQKELSQVLLEFSGETKSPPPHTATDAVLVQPPISFGSRVLYSHKGGAWQEYLAELCLGTLHLYNLSSNSTTTTTTTPPRTSVSSFVVYQAHATALPDVAPPLSDPLSAWKYQFRLQLSNAQRRISTATASTTTSTATTSTADKEHRFRVQQAQDRNQWLECIQQMRTTDMSVEDHTDQLVRACFQNGGVEVCDAVEDYIQQRIRSKESSRNGGSGPVETETGDRKLQLIRPLARIQPSPVVGGVGGGGDAQRHAKMSARLKQLRGRMEMQQHIMRGEGGAVQEEAAVGSGRRGEGEGEEAAAVDGSGRGTEEGAPLGVVTAAVEERELIPDNERIITI